jgi:hypothetical protein
VPWGVVASAGDDTTAALREGAIIASGERQRIAKWRELKRFSVAGMNLLWQKLAWVMGRESHNSRRKELSGTGLVAWM